jgi:MtN3 and saliva related transmembrane protein
MENVLANYQQWIGIAAGIFTSISLMPPLIKLIREKKPDAVPFGMLIVLLVGLCLWIVYGCIRNDWPIILTNGFSLIQNVTMIVLRQHYKKNK